ncbi:MAG: uroporphyrinogen decarboxylase family protein [Acidobacteriota bacterium]|nr:uroporphyrinogen decarboxylase family protein [Acidobacteriota bacterium]
MTSKERVLAALAHREPDRIPVDFGASSVTGLHVKIVGALRSHYGLAAGPVKVHEPYQMLGLVEEDLKQALGLDVDGVFPPETMFGYRNEDWTPWRLDDGTEVLMSGHFKTVRDANGDTLVFPKGDTSVPPSGRLPKGGYFFDTIIRQPPLEEAALDPADNLEEFGPISDADLDHFDARTRETAASGRAVLATFGGLAFGDIALVPAPFLKHPRGIRDVEEWYVSTLTRTDLLHRIFEKQAAIALANLEKIAARVGDRVDVVFVCGTDFGTQQSTFCSIRSFRSLYLPYYKIINDWIHKHTGWKTFKHTCGAVASLLPSLIESGFDILNPVQVSAAGMDAAQLKSDYGRDLVFWGGGVDTQKTLMFGTPAEVRDEVRRRLDIFGRGGGYVFNSIHNIQANVPPANVVALFETLREAR